ncbi:MAG: zf-HC2 domain-containing protein [Desulfobaccales bacterium]
MRWQCALLQRWLPEYPDGDLPAFAKRWLTAHVERCSACRQELAGLKEAVAAIETTPVGDPGPEFWNQFSRELHLKLAQAAAAGQEPAPRRWGFNLPYLVGVPALAVLLVWGAVYFTGSGNPVQDQKLARQAQAPAEVAKMAPVKPPTPVAAAPAAGGNDQIVPVALEEGAALPEEEVDISGWDLDSELSGMTDQEKERFLNKLHQRAKDGSCVEGFSYCSWG